MKTASLIINFKNEQSVILAHQVADKLKAAGVKLLLPTDKIGFSTFDKGNVDFSGVDVLIVLGGDGTILAASDMIGPLNLPIFGINLGQVGFLTEVEAAEAMASLDSLLVGDYRLEKRIKLQGKVIRGGDEVVCFQALNDFIISNNAYSRTITLDVSYDGQPISNYRADGIIVATPTGSTAYSLSAGGPIATPNMDFMIITPVCPHGFFSRPLIVPSNGTVRVDYHSKSDGGNFVGDGQSHFLLEENDRIEICKSEEFATFIRREDYSFFSTVKNKLLAGKQ